MGFFFFFSLFKNISNSIMLSDPDSPKIKQKQWIRTIRKIVRKSINNYTVTWKLPEYMLFHCKQYILLIRANYYLSGVVRGRVFLQWAVKNLGDLPHNHLGFPGDSVVKNLPASAGDARDAGLTSRLGRFPGLGNGNPLKYSCLENSMHRGPWRAIVHGVARGWTPLSDWAHTYFKAIRMEQNTPAIKTSL